MQDGWSPVLLDLAVDLRPDGQGLQMTMEYNADVFLERTVQRVAANYLVRWGPVQQSQRP